MKLLFTLTVSLLSFSAIANKTYVHDHVDCTKEPRSKWMKKEEFRKKLEEKYKIKVMQITPGNCYEIYGREISSNKKIEIYFNPVTGAVVKDRDLPQ